MKKTAFALLLLYLIGSLLSSACAGILTSKHNLSVTGTGDIIALTETRVCVFCHIPHNASPQGPLWNRADSGQNYILYSSSTADAVPDQPTGSSILCLSCHDGTIALGDLISVDTPIAMTSELTGRSNLGTDLSDDHPISFEYTEDLAATDGKLVSPSVLTGAVKLDKNSQLQCTSCHDPHNDVNEKFLVMNASNGALCQTCHIIFHGSTPHELSTQTWDGTGTDPWPNTEWTTVAENACFNCHTPHAANGPRLLQYANEEDNCLVCHNGHVAETDIDKVFQKPFIHPLDRATGEHDPVEELLVTARHVECQDCHNGHAVLSTTEEEPEPGGPLTHVAGITIDGVEIDPITNQYQLCFRCHGDTQDATRIDTERLVPEPNVRRDFDTANPSYHPVAGTGQNPNVPSLISPLTASSIIKCTDCHNNDGTDSTAAGPHGSIYDPILERQYVTDDGTAESATVYALCYKCHDQTSILGNESFPRHSKHITGAGGGQGGGGSIPTPCNVCHDPHGVRANGGIGGVHSGTHLLNFEYDPEIVTENSSGLLYHEDTGDFSGSCYLSCHGKNHNPCSYTSTGASCGGGGGPGGGGGGGGN